MARTKQTLNCTNHTDQQDVADIQNKLYTNVRHNICGDSKPNYDLIRKINTEALWVTFMRPPVQTEHK